jgi:hypothetical protein
MTQFHRQAANSLWPGLLALSIILTVLFAIPAKSLAETAFTITPSAGPHGKIMPPLPAAVPIGGNAAFTITPDPGYRVADVLIDGTTVGAVGDYTFTNVQQAHNIAASFAMNASVTITASASANGSISPAGAVKALSGSAATFSMAPATGYVVADVIVDGVSAGAVKNYTFTDIPATDHTISAAFQPNVNLSAQRDSNEGISFPWPVVEGTASITLDAAPVTFTPGYPLVFSNLPVGTHLFRVEAMDNAGNPSSAWYSWTVDPTVNTTLLSITPPLSFTNSKTITFTYGSNVGVGFNGQLDGAPLARVATAGINYSGLADGTHTFVVFAYDKWGYQDPVGASYSWVVDTVAPIITSITHSFTRHDVTITWYTNEPATQQVNWGLGSSTNNVIPDNEMYTTSHTVTISGLYSGTQYSYYVSGKDRAGNPYQSAMRSFKTNY